MAGSLDKATRRATHERRSSDSDKASAESRSARLAAKEAMAQKAVSNLVVQPMSTTHTPFICDTWARSFLHSEFARAIPNDVYKVEHRARIARLIERSICLCLVSKDSADFVSGYVVFEPPKDESSLPMLHYLLIHLNLQGKGFGTQLFNLVAQTRNSTDDPIWATHWTLPMRRISHKWNLLYNPYLLEIETTP